MVEPLLDDSGVSGTLFAIAYLGLKLGPARYMRIKKIRLRGFKRFDDLTIDLGESPAKLVAMVGPNGCGKSSVFDAFEQELQRHVGYNSNIGNWFYSKPWFDATNPTQLYDRDRAIQMEIADPSAKFGQKSFYVRSAYRFTPTLSISSIQQKGDPITDTERPGHSSNLDRRLQGNYERMHGKLVAEFYGGNKTGEQMRAELIGSINNRLRNVLDVQIASLGDVTAGKGQLFFEKGTSLNFPYENLSAGEKEVVDLIIDLEVKRTVFDDTVYCIDEPELHLNTGIQRKLLVELVDMVPATCQLWVATHSIGFLRALQQEFSDAAQILDFSEKDYFSGEQTLRPISTSRANWKRIFSTALEDLTGLLSPERIVYCEGRSDPNASGGEQGLDALAYNQVFETSHSDTLFVSSGGGGEVSKNAGLALKVLGKAFDSVDLILLRDRDTLTEVERASFLSSATSHRMLERREVENYLMDVEVLKNFCQTRGAAFDESQFAALVPDIVRNDLKAGQTIQRLALLCGFQGTNADFKKALIPHLLPGMLAFADLERSIFS